MNRTEAEDLIYRSYMKAEKYQKREQKDSEKRRPDLTKEAIRGLAGTPCIAVTGSKGKGSVANMISLILQSKYKVGLMTSPHLVQFNERFRVNQLMISDAEFTDVMDEIAPTIDKIEKNIPENVCISPMGIQAMLALKWFYKSGTDYNVLECGKGARYDDVNNTLHEYAVINSIFPEHTRELGNTLSEIAFDKAHIITGEQKCVYVGRQSEEALSVIEERAKQYGVPLKYYGRDFGAENIRYGAGGMTFDVWTDDTKIKDITIPLMGEHQARNCALAMALCMDILEEPNEVTIRENLHSLDWPGRLELLRSEPIVVLDACINRGSCIEVKNVLRHMNVENAIVVIGIPDDKDYMGVACEMQEMAKTIILTRANNSHYVFTDIQAKKLCAANISVISTETIEEAQEKASAALRERNAPIVILGTTALVAEIKQKKLFSRLESIICDS